MSPNFLEANRHIGCEYISWLGAQEPHLGNHTLVPPAPSTLLGCRSFYGHIAGLRSRINHWHPCFGDCRILSTAR